ncbi:MAG: hypothetical protein RI958_73 [Actinomycetota bacterium]|jgi:hypothetical protein
MTTNDTAPQRLVSDMRGVRYGEVLAISLTEDGFRGEVYGTQMLHDCPQEWWDELDPVAIAHDLGVLVAKLNGPRYWTLDGLGTKVAVVEPIVRDFNGLPLRRIATIELGHQPPVTAPYERRHVNRGAVFFFDAGAPVHELVDPDGNNYVMQAYCVGVDPSLTSDGLHTLGERLALPAGWAYRTRVLETELVVDTTASLATVLQDEFENTYTLPW